MVFKLKAFLLQLLFEQRVEHDGGCAGVFEAADAVDFLRERRCGGDQRRAQLQAEIIWC